MGAAAPAPELPEHPPRPRAPGMALASLFAVALAALFVGVALRWEALAPGGAYWGDSYPNTEQIRTLVVVLEEVGLKGLFFDERLFTAVLRAPGAYLYLGLSWYLLGASYQTLTLAVSLALALGGLCIFWALALTRAGPWAGLLAMALFLGAPETVCQGHNLLQVGLAASAFALALLGVSACARGRAWGALALGLGLTAALMTRRQMSAIAFVPVALYALPALARHVRTRWRALALLGGLLPGIALLSVALPWVLGRSSAGFRVEGAWLLLAGGVALTLWLGRRREDALKADGALLLGISLAASLTLPFYLDTLAQSAEHLEQSGAKAFMGAEHILPLVRFQYLALFLRGLQPVALPLVVVGALVTLTRGHRALGAVSLLSLLAAALTYFTFFHARYVYPLIVPVAVLGGLAAAPLKRLGPALALPFLALSALRIGGWLLPIDLPTGRLEEVGTEAIDWHEGPWRQALSATGPNHRPYPELLFTLPPTPRSGVLEGLIRESAPFCPPDRICGLTVFDVPPTLGIAQNGGAFFETATFLTLGAPELPLDAWSTLSGGAEQLAIFLYTEEAELDFWLAHHAGVPFEVMKILEDRDYQGFILRTLKAAPDGSIGAGWRPPDALRWDEMPQPRRAPPKPYVPEAEAPPGGGPAP